MHAVANVVTVALPPLPHPSVTATAEPTEETFEAWLADTNAKLPPDVRVLARSRAPPQFNADTACERRRFEYLVKYSSCCLFLELNSTPGSRREFLGTRRCAPLSI
jgi:tRNA pseudouridine(38-40) synthase